MIKQIIKDNILTHILKIIPIRGLINAVHINPAIFYYHIISDKNVPHVKNLYPYKNIQKFRSDIDFLLNNFESINLFELMDVLERKRQFNKKCFLLTFDDGFSEMYDIVRPILLEKGVSATFFVNSDFIDNKKICYQHMASVIVEHIKYGNVKKTKLNKIKEILSRHKLEIGWIELTAINYQKKHLLDEISRVLDIDFNNYLSENKPYLTSEQIKKLVNDGFTIGAHSIDHPLYENLTLEEQLHQTIESVNFVKEKFSLNYGVFAFPHMDAGVSKQFFSEIYKDDLVDLSFGTGGLISDVISRNLQRVSLENPPRPAEYNVPYNYLKKVYWNFLGKKQRSRFEV